MHATELVEKVKAKKKDKASYFSNGKKHDFKLFKESNVRWTNNSGYTGIKKPQKNSRLPKKSSKKKPLTKEEKRQNREISSDCRALQL